ncbi:glycosyltransferase [Mariniblastus sp.]|nr:glycosyltransferase [Mariniblastus sp.]
MHIKSVDIAICTWNRAGLLQRTLESFSKLSVPDGVRLSVVVVDNRSTDETQSVIDAFATSDFGKANRVVSATEDQQGHTFARNRAIQVCEGDLVVWTDDDVLVDSDWIESYVDAAGQQPSVSFWGGRIEPAFLKSKPKWIDDNWEALSGCFAARDLGNEPVELSADRLPYGANFAVRGDVQRANLFDPELGRRADLVLGEDELDLMRRLLHAGHRGQWVPGAVVSHLIPPERATTKYVYEYFIGQGSNLILKGEGWGTDADQLKREANAEYRRFWIKRFYAGNQQWCSHLIRSALAMGQSQAMTVGQ